jgi:hypothetical protein
MVAPLTEYEESIAFYYELGAAITAWADVEKSLLWIVTACFPKSSQERAATGFLSIENFRSKMVVADRLFTNRFGSPKHVDQWKQLYSRLEKLSKLRNHLAHFHAKWYVHARPGRRGALIPTISETPKFRSRTPQPPSGSLFLRDIVHARHQFNGLSRALEFLVYRAKGQKTQLPTSFAQVGDAPTMEQLVRQIRPILAKQPAP